MRILIADDDPVSRRVLEATLRRWGHSLVVCQNGWQAWEELQKEDAPRLAILDWMMPGMDGLQVCAAVRQRQQERYTYLLLLTARGQKEDLVAGLDAGADDYLTKPFHAHELKARLRAGKRILDLEEQLIEAREALRIQATRDPITGLWNHAAIVEALQRELARVSRERQPLAVVMIDLDHFKRVNDTYGHLVGDAVLREAARRLSTAIRSYDAIGRYGGEEFLIVFPNCTRDDAVRRAERLRLALCQEPIHVPQATVSVSASFGVAAIENPFPTDGDILLHAADEALYAAKRSGRNRVE